MTTVINVGRPAVTPMEMSLYYVVYVPGRGRKIEMLKGPFGTSAEAYAHLRTLNLVERAGTYVENTKMKVVMTSVGIVGVKE